MLVKTKAIVLRNVNYSESSVICKMYTREFGIRTYMVNGVRKAKAKISIAMLQPLSILDLEAYEKPNANIQHIKELKNTPLLLQIAQDFRKRSVALFVVELLNACLLAEEGEPELFDYLLEQVLHLERGDEVSNFSLLFMIGLGRALGIDPQGNYAKQTPYFDLLQARFVSQPSEHSMNEALSELLHMLRIQHPEVHLNMSGSQRKELLNYLILYYQMHIMKDKEMKSLKVLSEVMEAWHTV